MPNNMKVIEAKVGCLTGYSNWKIPSVKVVQSALMLPPPGGLTQRTLESKLKWCDVAIAQRNRLKLELQNSLRKGNSSKQNAVMVVTDGLYCPFVQL